MNSRQEYRSKLSFFTTNILQNVFPLFAVTKSVKAFKVLYIKPGMILGQIIVSNLKNLPQKTTLDFMKLPGKKNIKCNNYSGLPVEMQLPKAIK